jgi:hypothetical protein
MIAFLATVGALTLLSFAILSVGAFFIGRGKGLFR